MVPDLPIELPDSTKPSSNAILAFILLPNYPILLKFYKISQKIILYWLSGHKPLINGFRSLPALIDGLHNQRRTPRSVSRRENPRPAGLHGRGVRPYRVPWGYLEAARLRGGNRVDAGILADGHDQGVEFDRVFRALNGHRPATAALIGIAQLVPDAFQPCQAPVFAEDPDRRDESLDPDLFLVRGLDLLGEGGHFVPGPPVQDGDAVHFLEAHGQHYYGSHEDTDEKLYEKLEKCTLDEENKTRADQAYGALNRFRAKMRELFPWFAALAFQSLGELDEVSKELFGYWSVRDDGAWDVLAEQARKSGNGKDAKAALKQIRRFAQVSGLPFGRELDR